MDIIDYLFVQMVRFIVYAIGTLANVLVEMGTKPKPPKQLEDEEL